MSPKTPKSAPTSKASTSSKPDTATKPGAKAKVQAPIKKNKFYDSKTQNTAGGQKRRVKVTEVKDGKVHYEPVNYTRARPGKGRPVSEATFRRDYALVKEEKAS